MNNRAPADIISQVLREEDVFPTMGALREDLNEMNSIIGALDKEVQVLQERLGPILVSGEALPPGEPNTENFKTGLAAAQEPQRCGLSADIQEVRKQVWALQARLRVITNWVTQLTSEVRL